MTWEWAVVGLGAVALVWPANWLVRAILSVSRGPGEQMPGAGRWIGALERLLIYVLVLIGEPGAAGLVVAAKSILRYPQISERPAEIDPEYVLVGSLTSWLIGFAVAAVVRLLVGS